MILSFYLMGGVFLEFQLKIAVKFTGANPLHMGRTNPSISNIVPCLNLTLEATSKKHGAGNVMVNSDSFIGVEEVVQAVSAKLKAPSLFSIEEIGIFHASSPLLIDCTPFTALQQTLHHFGIASWALNPMYIACKQRLAQNRRDIDAATAMLLVCPDYLTAWNVRKALFDSDFLDAELHFSSLILTRDPKSSESWTHRHWILKTVKMNGVSPHTELNLAWMAASRAYSNYYATVHRIRLIDALDTETLTLELHTSRKWLRIHVGDSAGWTYHRRLLCALAGYNATSPIQEESEWFKQMDDSYSSSHQNVNIHKRWLHSTEFPYCDH